MTERRTLLPAFPHPRLLPWVLGAAAAAALVLGIVTGRDEAALLGGIGLGAVVVGYPLARLVLGPGEPAAPDDAE